jgi:hypothetical protein
MEAADEIPRQLRLRDLGGVIICDFIDLRYERHRRDLERRLHENLRKDRAKTKVLRMSQFGIIEMTRQRMRPSLKRSIYFDCPHCKGSGLVKTPESMSLDVMRRLAIAVNSQRVHRVEMSVCPDVAFFLLNRKRAQIAGLESAARKRVVVKSDAHLGLDELRMELYDSRDGLIYLDEFGGPPLPQQEQRPRRHQQQRAPDFRGRTSQHRPVPQPVPREVESMEDDLEEREEERAIESASAGAMHVPGAQEPPGASNVVDVDEGAEPVGAAPRGMDEQSEGGGGRRRRRRGRRGRGRGRGAQGQGSSGPAPIDVEAAEVELDETQIEIEPPLEPQDEPVDSEAAPPAPPGPPAEQADEEDTGRRRRRRRGGRRHRRRKDQVQNNGEPRERVPSAATVAPPVRPASPPRVPSPPVVRTGSTDKHLMRDEVPEAPARRPRTYRDLDSIPEDFD